MREVRFSLEEKQEDEKEIREMLTKPMTYSKIAKELGRSPTYVECVKKRLVENDKSIQDEIDNAWKAKKEEKQRIFEEQVWTWHINGKNRNYIKLKTKRSYKDIDLAIEKMNKKYNKNGEMILTKAEREKQEKKQKILNEWDKKSYPEKISRDLGIPRTTVGRYIKELIDEGKIKEGDIINGNEVVEKENKTGKMNKIKNNDIRETETGELDTIELQIIECLTQKGFTYQYTSKKLKLNQSELMEKVKELKSKKIITQKDIDEARSRRKQENKEKILNYYIPEGYSETDIAEEIEGMYCTAVVRLIKELKDEGLITQEKIEEYRYYAEQGNAKIEQIVLDNIGYTVKEIVELDEEGFLTESKVRRAKKRLEEQGRLLSKKDQNVRKKRSENKRQLEYKEDRQQIYDLLKKGFYRIQIHKELDISCEYISDRIKEIQKNKKMTKEDIQELIKKGRQTLIEKQKLLSAKIQTEKSKQIVIQEFIDNIKMMRKLDIKISEKYIKQLENIVLYEENYKTKENFKLVVMLYVNLGKYESVDKFMNTFVSDCQDQEQRRKFGIIRDVIKKSIKKDYAIRLLKEDINILEVMNETGLSETEVLELRRYAKSKESPVIIGD